MLSRFSHVQLFMTPWTIAHQAPLPMGFSRQEYWSGLPWPPPGCHLYMDGLVGSEVKVSARNAGDPGSIPGSGRSPGEGNGNPLQYSRLENPMDGGAWWATVHGVAKSRTQLSDFTFTFSKVPSLNEYKTF